MQKLHYVGPFMVMGFAGSVELGLRAVNDFRHYLSGIPEGAMAHPGFVTWHWARVILGGILGGEEDADEKRKREEAERESHEDAHRHEVAQKT